MTASKYCCPTCGHPILPKDPLAFLHTTERAIFNIIYAAGQAGITRQAVHDRVYDGTRNSAESRSVVCVHIRNMNKKLRWIGLEILSERSNEAHYRVRKVPELEGAR